MAGLSESDIALIVALTRTGTPGATGPAGPTGPAGAVGPAGPPGPGGGVFPTTNQRWVNAIDGDDSAAGTIGDPFATLQKAIDDIGAPTTMAEFEREAIIHVIGYGPVTTGVFTTRRWHLMLDPGIVVGNLQMQEVEADRFGSTFPASINISCQGTPSPSTSTVDGGATVGSISVVHAGAHASLDVHIALTNVNHGGITLDSGVTALIEQHGGLGRSITGDAAVFFGDRCRLGTIAGTDHLTCLAVAAIRDSALMVGNITVTAASPGQGYRAISRSLFGTVGVTWTGPASSFVVDRVTNATFVSVAGALAGGATRVIVDPVVDNMPYGAAFSVTTMSGVTAVNVHPGFDIVPNAAALGFDMGAVARGSGRVTIRDSWAQTVTAAGVTTAWAVSVHPAIGGATVTSPDDVRVLAPGGPSLLHSVGTGLATLPFADGDMITVAFKTTSGAGFVGAMSSNVEMVYDT